MTRDELTSYSVKLTAAVSLSEDFDGGDVYGSAINIAFDCAEILDYRDDDIPDHWEYKRGMGAAHLPESSLYEDHESDYLRLLGNRCIALIDLVRDLEEKYPHLQLTY